jgi:hypothetical protein
MSGLAIGLPFLSNASYPSSSSHGGVCFSIHRSGMVNGLTQVMALAGDASAVATAPTSAVFTPKYCAMSVDTGLPRDAVRRTLTRTRLGSPVGSLRNCTSPGVTETFFFITWLPVDALIALVTAGPEAVRLS